MCLIKLYTVAPAFFFEYKQEEVGNNDYIHACNYPYVHASSNVYCSKVYINHANRILTIRIGDYSTDTKTSEQFNNI